MLLTRHAPRRGTVLLESAVVYPVVLLLILGIVLMSLAVFRYQQVAHIAREAARWAAVRGAQRGKELDRPALTPQEVYEGAILPQAAGMRPEHLTFTVTWDADQRPHRPVTRANPTTGAPEVVYVTNTVTVRVTYTWNTLLFGTIPVSSTSVNPMAY